MALHHKIELYRDKYFRFIWRPVVIVCSVPNINGTYITGTYITGTYINGTSNGKQDWKALSAHCSSQFV